MQQNNALAKLRGGAVDELVVAMALCSYMHKFYENSYTTSKKSGKRMTLMVRDLHAVYQAMGDTVVEPKREAADEA